jgi:hypothetical protein
MGLGVRDYQDRPRTHALWLATPSCDARVEQVQNLKMFTHHAVILHGKIGTEMCFTARCYEANKISRFQRQV